MAVAISVYAIVSTRRAEAKMLKISFLLPHLSEISEKLLDSPFPEEVIERIKWITEMSAFFRKKYIILHSLGLGAEMVPVLSGKGEVNENKGSLLTIISTVQSKYRELIRLDS